MSVYFKYSILTYTHSQLLNEKINVGILFYFPESTTQRILFKHPRRFQRLGGLYTDFSEWQLRQYLTALETKANKINSRLRGKLDFDVNRELTEYLHNEFIKEDASTLQFSEIKNGKIFDSIDNIVNQFYNLYFSIYENEADNRERHNEEYVLLNLKHLFTKKNEASLNRLYSNKIIKNETTECKFDYAWKNGTWNFIKPISFDLIDPLKVNHKAIKWRGVFELLNNNNYKFDLLIAHPQIDKSKEVFEEYEKALKILAGTKAKKTINEEDKFEEYVDEVIQELSSHPQPEEGETPFED